MRELLRPAVAVGVSRPGPAAREANAPIAQRSIGSTGATGETFSSGPAADASAAQAKGAPGPVTGRAQRYSADLTLAVEVCRGRAEKTAALERILADVGPPGIVYAATRRNVEDWRQFLAGRGLATGGYHGGLADRERDRVQDDFLAGRAAVIAATNAFGMGVDKADIRFVVHADVPGSVEAYSQEAGRAGRDGRPARCTLLFSPADVRRSFASRGRRRRCRCVEPRRRGCRRRSSRR